MNQAGSAVPMGSGAAGFLCVGSGALSAGCVDAGAGNGAVGVEAGLRQLDGLPVVAAVDGNAYVGVVDEGEQGSALAFVFDVPAHVFLVVVEAHAHVGFEVADVVALSVAAHQEAVAVGAFDDFFGGGVAHGVASAPEFDAVEHQDVSEAGHFVDRKNPECEEHEFVEELVAYGLVPAQQAVGQREAADARCSHDRGAEQSYYGCAEDGFSHSVMDVNYGECKL